MSKNEFNKLLEKKGKDLISLYVPTHVKGQEVLKGKDTILLKDLIKEIENKLEEKGYGTREIDSKLEKARALTSEKDFWRNQSHALALFIDNEDTLVYRLPIELNNTLSYIGPTFYVRPLVKLTTDNNPFYILFVSKTKLRLYKASGYHMEEIDISGKVPDMEEAFKYDAPERSLQYHSGNAGGSPIYHGHGLPDEEEIKDLKRYFNKADKALMEFLNNKSIPMVLAGVDYLIPLYREKSGYPNITSESVNTDPKSKDPEEIHQMAKTIIQSKGDGKESKSNDRFQHLAGTDKVSTELPKIIHASYFNRIDALYIDENVEDTWGHFYKDKDELEIHDEKGEKGDEELINRAIINAIKGGGNVYIGARKDLPGDNSVAALLRY